MKMILTKEETSLLSHTRKIMDRILLKRIKEEQEQTKQVYEAKQQTYTPASWKGFKTTRTKNDHWSTMVRKEHSAKERPRNKYNDRKNRQEAKKPITRIEYHKNHLVKNATN